MKAILISGLWPDSGSNGLSDLALKIAAAKPGLECQVFRYDASITIPMPDIIIGFSLGGEVAVNIAKTMENKPVKYMALIDPVHHSWFPFWFWVPGKHFHIPVNVDAADCFKRIGGIIPPSSKILNESMSFKNYKVNMSHSDAPRCQLVLDKILERIKKL